MGDQSHRDEMSAAIRAQRERQAVPRSIAPEEPDKHEQPAPEPEEARRRSLLNRLRSK